jgi:DNA excision repair protein ERCC-2
MPEEENELKGIERFFPHEKAREFQDELVYDIYHSIKKGQSILINAPTGIGKTAGALAPALKYLFDEKAKGKKLKIFFLTGRHTQHSIVIETIRRINERGMEVIVADIFGKKFLCGFEDVVNFLPSDFSEYCKSLRAEKKCHYYSNTTDASSQEKKFSKAGLEMISRLKLKSSETVELRRECKDATLCPYEIACGIAKDADVVICDYNHLFNRQIREGFFKKIGADLENSIIIIDEAHNLPERLREMLSMEISEKSLQFALRENKRFSQNCADYLRAMIEFFIEKQSDEEGIKTKFGETLIENSDIIDFLKSRFDMTELMEAMGRASEEIRRQQRRSFLGRVCDFLVLVSSTQDYDEFITIGYSSRTDNMFTIEYFCVDPSILTKEVIEKSKSMILMSATLEPLEMYSDVLGFDYPNMKSYKNPFPDRNRLTLIIPETTTKYEERSEVEYKRIAFHVGSVLSFVPGRAAVFFPSYEILDSVVEKSKISGRKLYVERQKLSKEGKAELIKNFVNDETGVLCAVVGASFSEGIDLPNKLKCVILVGLPLRPPNIKSKKLIQLYQERFGRGFDYGYFVPAMNKAIQSAGRCIRSSSDFGALVFLDKRYEYENYRALMPKDWKMVSTSYYDEVLSDFFKKKR